MKITEFNKIATILGKKHKIQVIEGSGWASNIKERKVFYKKNDVYNLPEEHILGLLLHEIAHIHYTTEVTLPEKNKELTHSTLNMLEDITIEHIISKDYPNAGEILKSTQEEILDTLVQMLPNMKNVSIFEKSLLYAAVKYQNRGYLFQTEKYEKIGKKIAKIMKKRNKELLERKKTKDLLPITEEIIKLLIKEAGQPTAQEKAMMITNSLGEIAATDNTENKQIKRKLIKTLKETNGWKGNDLLPSNANFIDEIADQAPIIGRKIRSILKINNAMEFGGRYRTGKIKTRRLIRIKINKDRRPFSKRIIKSNQSYAFAIASDVSGSMGSSKYSSLNYALTSMHMVGEALHYAKIPRALIIFGNNENVVAPMGRKKIDWNQISNTKELEKADRKNTKIDEAINACTKELSQIRAERKIMIVLTDGSSDLKNMQEAHKKATKAEIECLGITIGKDTRNYMDKTFSEEKNIVIEDIKDTKQIGEAFLSILKKTITKSP